MQQHSKSDMYRPCSGLPFWLKSNGGKGTKNNNRNQKIIQWWIGLGGIDVRTRYFKESVLKVGFKLRLG